MDQVKETNETSTKLKKAQVISFISGKGGSGKTSLSISMAELLSFIGFKVLVIDFDLVTSGATYFFMNLLADKKKRGILEILRDYSHYNKIQLSSIEVDIIQVSNDFYFLASESAFKNKEIDWETSEEYHKSISEIFPGLIDLLKSNYDFIIIDNQAGGIFTSRLASSLSSKVVLVAEPDGISIDAAYNLRDRIGGKFPPFQRFLINKVVIEEAEQYRTMDKAFSMIRTLPPLPFDFKVREAFGARQMPLNPSKPSALLFAIFQVLKQLLPEIRDELEDFEKSRITELFGELEKDVNKLTEKREETLSELEYQKTIPQRAEQRLISMTTAILAMAIATFSLIYGLFRYSVSPSLFYSMLGMTVALIITLYGTLRGKISKEKYKGVEEQWRLENQLKEVDKELDRYKSLLLSRSEDLLIDFTLDRDQRVK